MGNVENKLLEREKMEMTTGKRGKGEAENKGILSNQSLSLILED